ncbi:MAG: hypothetical protein D6681_21595, partial [Calditrichaeota bacterium]
MKCSWLFGVLLPVVVWAQAVDTTFSELRGMQDAGGSTHLFYRKYSLYQTTSGYNKTNHIYHLDLAQGVDTLFLRDFSILNNFQSETQTIREFLFFDQDPARWIVAGEYAILDPDGFIMRYTGDTVFYEYGRMWFMAQSQQNPDLLYAFHEIESLLRSQDGGYTWVPDSLAPQEMIPFSLSPFNDQILFATHYGDGKLYKSTDGGHTYVAVDSSVFWLHLVSEIYYDADAQHLYAAVNSANWVNFLMRSTDGGDNWHPLLWKDDKIRIGVDPAQPGRLFLGVGDTLWRSEDFGDSFTLYWPL